MACNKIFFIDGLGWVEGMTGWVELGYENRTHGHVWSSLTNNEITEKCMITQTATFCKADVFFGNESLKIFHWWRTANLQQNQWYFTCRNTFSFSFSFLVIQQFCFYFIFMLQIIMSCTKTALCQAVQGACRCLLCIHSLFLFHFLDQRSHHHTVTSQRTHTLLFTLLLHRS